MNTTTDTTFSAGHSYITDKRTLLIRLHKIEGQVRGLERMVNIDANCIDILTQVSAATRALESVALSLLDAHLRHCVTDAARSEGADAQLKVAEATEAIARLVRS